MWPRFAGRLGPADVVTVANGVLGFVGVLAATVDPELAARLVLLAAIGDGLDGVVARHVKSTPVGEHLDSLADVLAFGAAPGVLVTAAAVEAWGLASPDPSVRLGVAVVIPALYAGMVVVRLGLYTAYDTGNHHTVGVPSTLAATVLAASVLAGIDGAAPLLAATALLTVLMVGTVTYPDLLARDAFIMGAVQLIALALPAAFGRAFPYALLVLAIAYLSLAPWFYWRSAESTAG